MSPSQCVVACRMLVGRMSAVRERCSIGERQLARADGKKQLVNARVTISELTYFERRVQRLSITRETEFCRLEQSEMFLNRTRWSV